MRCDLSWLLSRKITKRIHSSKPASLNRPIAYKAKFTQLKTEHVSASVCGLQVMGIGGNALNIYVFAVRWKANMSFTFFLSCLAACHIAKCAICGPLLIYTSVQDVVHGELPYLSCILIRICFVFFILIASFILTLLAVDRCHQVSCFWVVAYCVRGVGGRSVNQSVNASASERASK